MAYGKEQGFFSRLVRSLVAVVVLSAFVVGIAFSVKSISTLDNKKLVSFSYKLLSRLNIDVEEDQIGQVAGKFAERLGDTSLLPEESPSLDDSPTYVGILSDIHDDLASLTRALNLAKEKGVTSVIVLGDLTDFGDVSSLQEVKKVLDNSSLTYYVLPGDHDLAQSVGTKNFLDVYGYDKNTVEISGVKMVLLDNSANFTPLLPENESWFKQEISDAKIIFLSQPLFSDGLSLPFSRMYMGSTSSDPNVSLLENQKKVKEQRDRLLSELRNSPVENIISGDHHRSSTINDPIKSGLVHAVVGAVTKEVNDLPQKIVQAPRFTIMKINEDGTYSFEEVLID